MSLFTLLYGVPTQIDPVNETGTDLVVPSPDYHRRMEILARSVPQAICCESSVQKKFKVSSSHFFKEGDKVS